MQTQAKSCSTAYLGKPVGKEGKFGLDMLPPVPTGLVTVPEVEGMLGTLVEGTLGMLLPEVVGTSILLAGLDMEVSPVDLPGLTLVLGTVSGLVTGVVLESPPAGVPIPEGVVEPGVVEEGVVVSEDDGLVVLLLVIGFFLAAFLVFFLVGEVACDTVETCDEV